MNQTENWVSVQHKTFTAWVNNLLTSNGHEPLRDLVSGLHGGVNLCLIVQELTHCEFAYEKEPKISFHSLSNVEQALKCLEQNHVRLVNISASDIVNGNLKIILGLIWTLIVTFEAASSAVTSGADAINVAASTTNETPKRRWLLDWIHSILDENHCSHVNNFASDWISGVKMMEFVNCLQRKYQMDDTNTRKNVMDGMQPLQRVQHAMDQLKKVCISFVQTGVH